MSEVTRSMEATSLPAAAYADRRRRDVPNAWWGVALFVATEATLFGTMIGSYFYLRFQSAHWPPAGIERPKVAVPLVLTGVLVSTTLPLVAAVRGARVGRGRLAWWLVLVALVIQAAYLGIQVHEFTGDLDKFSPKGSAYGSIYFTLLGAHHVHVAIGILLELWLLARLLAGFTNYRFVGLRVIALYWYFVNLLAIPVLLTQIYPSL
ncbi:MAG: heme-copper oxidase subunit III [Thermoleophilaceae bacterium]